MLIYLLPHGNLFPYLILKQIGLCFRGNKPVTDRVKKKAKVVIRNWECGVVSSTEKMGFGNDSWDILKRFMIVEGAVPVIQVGKPWIREENDHF